MNDNTSSIPTGENRSAIRFNLSSKELSNLLQKLQEKQQRL
jgi:hypothetical protein